MKQGFEVVLTSEVSNQLNWLKENLNDSKASDTSYQ